MYCNCTFFFFGVSCTTSSILKFKKVNNYIPIKIVRALYPVRLRSGIMIGNMLIAQTIILSSTYIQYSGSDLLVVHCDCNLFTELLVTTSVYVRTGVSSWAPTLFLFFSFVSTFMKVVFLLAFIAVSVNAACNCSSSLRIGQFNVGQEPFEVFRAERMQATIQYLLTTNFGM